MSLRAWIPVLGLAAASCGSASPTSVDSDARAPATTAGTPSLPRSVEVASAAAPIRLGACSFASPGVHVGAQDVERGAALVFATKDDVAGLREGLLAHPSTIAMASDVAPRADVVRGGIRFVYEASSVEQAKQVRALVERFAREVARRCDLSYGLIARDEPAPPPTPAVEPSPAPSSSGSAPAPEAKPGDKPKDAAPPGARPPKDDGKKGDAKDPAKKPKEPPKEPAKDAPKPPAPPPLPPPPQLPTPPRL